MSGQFGTKAIGHEQAATQPMARDHAIQMIAARGRMGWQRESGYNRRRWLENGFYRYQTIIGRRLNARGLSNQQNHMTQLGMPASKRVG